jgi:hypothetical protein
MNEFEIAAMKEKMAYEKIGNLGKHPEAQKPPVYPVSNKLTPVSQRPKR